MFVNRCVKPIIFSGSWTRNVHVSTTLHKQLSKLYRARKIMKNNNYFSSDVSSNTVHKSPPDSENSKQINKSSVYIHWPYCRRKCTYCNFNKYVSKTVDNDRMVYCLLKEWDKVAGAAGVDEPTSLFFGGGTPSLMRPGDIKKIIREQFDQILYPNLSILLSFLHIRFFFIFQNSLLTSIFVYF